MTSSPTNPPVGLRRQFLKVGERNLEVSQQAILEAATEEFSLRGLEGARVDQIASKAGINKQLLYRYFGNKEDLYFRVLEDAYCQIRESEKALGLPSLEPRTAIRVFIASMVERIYRQPHFARLVIDENFHEGQHLKHSSRVRALAAEILEIFEDVLARGVDSGDFRKGVDAVQLFTSIASLSTFYVTNMHTLSVMFGERFKKLYKVPTMAAHIERVIFGFVLSDPTAYMRELPARSARKRKPRSAD